MFLQKSPRTLPTAMENKEKVILIYQYFVHRNKARASEVAHCLRMNVANPLIDEIILLNERIYSSEELGVDAAKVRQVDIGRRVTFQDIFVFARKEALQGYVVTCNADMFFDVSLRNLFRSGLHLSKAAYALLRFEYTDRDLRKCKLFGPRADSQDVWIFHSSFLPTEAEAKLFNFPFGKLGCDNKLAYLLAILGYEVRNDPLFIRTYHHHRIPIRDYSRKERVRHPYLGVAPYTDGSVADATWAGPNVWAQKYGYTVNSYTGNGGTFMFDKDNHTLASFIASRLKEGRPFLIPRVSHAETNMAHAMKLYDDVRAGRQRQMGIPQLTKYIGEGTKVLKNNAGIRADTLQLLRLYSQMYFAAFEHADLCLTWAPWDNMFPITVAPHRHIYDILRRTGGTTLYAGVLDIFNYIQSHPWTQQLRGKRLLLISPFVESIKTRVPYREGLYGVDLFPECEFVFLKPPQTQGTNKSRPFIQEFQDFVKRIEAVKDEFDVALVSCGGYGNLVCDGIFKMGKSAIFIGGVLQMYFGIYGQRWMRDNPDILRLYMNKRWGRPSKEERPEGYKGIEGACYF